MQITQIAYQITQDHHHPLLIETGPDRFTRCTLRPSGAVSLLRYFAAAPGNPPRACNARVWATESAANSGVRRSGGRQQPPARRRPAAAAATCRLLGKCAGAAGRQRRWRSGCGGAGRRDHCEVHCDAHELRARGVTRLEGYVVVALRAARHQGDGGRGDARAESAAGWRPARTRGRARASTLPHPLLSPAARHPSPVTHHPSPVAHRGGYGRQLLHIFDFHGPRRDGAGGLGAEIVGCVIDGGARERHAHADGARSHGAVCKCGGCARAADARVVGGGGGVWRTAEALMPPARSPCSRACRLALGAKRRAPPPACGRPARGGRAQGQARARAMGARQEQRAPRCGARARPSVGGARLAPRGWRRRAITCVTTMTPTCGRLDRERHLAADHRRIRRKQHVRGLERRRVAVARLPRERRGAARREERNERG